MLPFMGFWSFVWMFSGKIAAFFVSIIPTVYISNQVTVSKLDLIFSGCLTCQVNEKGVPSEGWCYVWHNNWFYIAYLSHNNRYTMYFVRSISDLIKEEGNTFTMMRVELINGASIYSMRTKAKEPNNLQRLLLELVTPSDQRKDKKRSIFARETNVSTQDELKHHSMLLIGPPGIGKSEFAQTIAYLTGAKCHPSINLCTSGLGLRTILADSTPTYTNKFALEFSEFNCAITRAFQSGEDRYANSSIAKDKSSLLGFFDWLKVYEPNLFVIATMNGADVLNSTPENTSSCSDQSSTAKKSLNPVDAEAMLRRFEFTVSISNDCKQVKVLRMTQTENGPLFESIVYKKGKNEKSGSWNSGYVSKGDYEKTTVAEWLSTL